MEEQNIHQLSPAESIRLLSDKITKELPLIQAMQREISKVIVGQDRMVERLLIALLANGHILLEGVPGLAKTLAIKTLSDTIGGDFSRVQFTPDLLPADITGTMIYNQKTQSFSVTKGPVFANFVLADEINRAPAKVQSALLEAMQERQVTIGDETFPLPKPFLVMATQNPVEQEGTYPLPEAQVDRFMLKVFLDYPKKEEEKLILRSNVRLAGLDSASQVTNPDEILRLRDLVREVYLDEKIEQYIIDIVFATRTPTDYGMPEVEPLISFGASPRASINLALAGKAFAFLKGRAYVIPEDIRAIAPDVLQHRIGLTYEAEAENIGPLELVAKILSRVEVP
ncbi:MAG: MoxR family ATPase [Crocinitomicaceae bacterium]|nr:MoxR family ATPase [Crocinitomicaceae bacterium]